MVEKTISFGGLLTSSMALGCASMSGEWYGAADWDESLETIRRAIDLGITLIDTADVYGAGHNEVLVGRAIAGRRHEVQIATKFGIDRSAGPSGRRIRGEPRYVLRSCEASLLRLGVDEIDLYYMHRVPDDVPLEDAVGAMAQLVEQGKVRHIGLSEVGSEQLLRAQAIHPIAAVESEFSLWSRAPERLVVDSLRALDVGLVAYAPLGQGFLSGSFNVDDLGATDLRHTSPRFCGRNVRKNELALRPLREVADKHGVTPAQIAIAWVYERGRELGIRVIALPGTKRSKWVEQNAEALDLELDKADMDTLSAVEASVVGAS